MQPIQTPSLVKKKSVEPHQVIDESLQKKQKQKYGGFKALQKEFDKLGDY